MVLRFYLLLLNFTILSIPFLDDNYISSKNEEDNIYEIKLDSLEDHLIEAEKFYSLPKGILKAIANVESVFNHYVVRVGKKAYKFKSTKDAKKFLSENYGVNERRVGNINVFDIDIGFMQVNLQHLKYFDDIEGIIEPINNIWFAARLLAYNITRCRSITKAIIRYNGSQGDAGDEYKNKVIRNWLKISGCKENIDIFSHLVKKQFSLKEFSSKDVPFSV